MSSIDSKGENEYSDDESNIVGKSGEEGEEQVSDRIKKEIRKDTGIRTQENTSLDWINLIFRCIPEIYYQLVIGFSNPVFIGPVFIGLWSYK